MGLLYFYIYVGENTSLYTRKSEGIKPLGKHKEYGQNDGNSCEKYTIPF